MKLLEDYLKYEQPTKYIVESELYNDNYETPVLTAGQSFILGYTNEHNNIFPSENLPVIIFDDFTTSVQYVDFPFKVKSSAMKILHPTKNANVKYFYYLLKSIKKNTTTHKRYWISEYSKIFVEEKSIVEQNNIAEKLNLIECAIFNRKQQIEDLKKLIKSYFSEMFQNEKYQKMKLCDVCDVRDGTHDSPKYLQKSAFKFITSKNIINDKISFEDIKYISKEDYERFNIRSKVNYGDILMPMIGTVGNPIIVNIKDKDIDFAIKNVALIKFFKESKVTNTYIKNILCSDYFNMSIAKTKRGGIQKFLALSDIRNIEIAIPPIEIQNRFSKIVDKINKQINLYENDIDDLENLFKTKLDEYFK